MALYDFRCQTCGTTSENVVLPMSAIGTDAEPHCCGARMTQYFAPGRRTMASVQGECHYQCPKTGELITSRRQRANNFARHGLMDANDFTPDFVKREQDEKWGRIRKLAAQHEETNRRIVGGDLRLADTIPADAA